MFNKENTIITIIITLLFVSASASLFISHEVAYDNNQPEIIQEIIQEQPQEITQKQSQEIFGKVHYNDGQIGATTTSPTIATRVLERNTGREYFNITNSCTEGVFIWTKNYTSTTTATAEVSRNGGTYLTGGGGSMELPNGDIANSYLWIGDIWASTTSIPCQINFTEK